MEQQGLPSNPGAVEARLETLKRYGLPEGSGDEFCSNIVLLASLLCETPFAAVTLLSHQHQFLKAAVGFPVTMITAKAESFCQYTIKHSEIMVVPNASFDERFSRIPFVTGPVHIRFYAGAPLKANNGTVLGSVCVLDVVERGLREEQRDGLKLLSENLTMFIGSTTVATSHLSL